MSSNHLFYEVIETIGNNTYYTTLKKEEAEKLYRKLRAKGAIVDIKKCVPKIKGLE